MQRLEVQEMRDEADHAEGGLQSGAPRPEQPWLGDRLHALDAVRGFALLSGIVLHATIAYLPGPAIQPGADESSSVTLAVLFYVIHIFRMMVFFLMAGFFAHLMFHRKGLALFVRDRVKRILLPFIAGWFVVAPPMILVFLWATRRGSGGRLPPLPRAFPLFHLWFLYYLLLMYTIVLVGRWVVAGLDRRDRIRGRVDRWLRALVQGPWALVVLAASLGVSLYLKREWLMWFGIPSPEFGLTPRLSVLIGYGTPFALGWLLHRQPDLLRVWEEWWPTYLGVAITATAVSIAIVGPTPSLSEGVPDAIKLAYAASYAVATWAWVFAIVGVALRFCSEASATRRYLADSSYWLYIVHLPLVFFLQVALGPLRWPWGVKFPLILGIACALLFPSYHYFVRFTVIGAVLNGRRLPRRRPPTVAIAG